MKEISLKELLEAGCHFGHQTTRWNPKMKPYIFTARDGIHIFDLVKTKEGLMAASAFAKATASQGGQIIFVGTKRQAQGICEEAAKKVGMPYVTRKWINGLITNWDHLSKRLTHLKNLKTDKTSGKYKEWTKKENLMIDREIAKIEREFGGVLDLKGIPAAVFVFDSKKDFSVLKEAKARGAATIAIVDTNTNPDIVDYPIPANDDAVKSIQLIVDYITGAIEEGLIEIKEKKEKIKNDEEKKQKKEVRGDPPATQAELAKALRAGKSEMGSEKKKEKKETKKKTVKRVKKIAKKIDVIPSKTK